MSPRKYADVAHLGRPGEVSSFDVKKIPDTICFTT